MSKLPNNTLFPDILQVLIGSASTVASVPLFGHLLQLMSACGWVQALPAAASVET